MAVATYSVAIVTNLRTEQFADHIALEENGIEGSAKLSPWPKAEPENLSWRREI
jgi:hypothetical protein